MFHGGRNIRISTFDSTDDDDFRKTVQYTLKISLFFSMLESVFYCAFERSSVDLISEETTLRTGCQDPVLKIIVFHGGHYDNRNLLSP